MQEQKAFAQVPAAEPVDGMLRMREIWEYVKSLRRPWAQDRPPRPHEVDDWLENVSLALTIATGLGCWRQWSIERRAGPVVTPPGLFGEAAARAVAEVNVRRLRRVLDAGLSRGMFLGTLTAVWCAAETASGLYRGSGPHRDVWDSMAASSFVGAVWGTLAADSGGLQRAQRLPLAISLLRLRGFGLGAAYGALFGMPIGVLNSRLRSWTHTQRQQLEADKAAAAAQVAAAQRRHSSSELDAAAELLRQLEASRAAAAAASVGTHPATATAAEELAERDGGSGSGGSSGSGDGDRGSGIWRLEHGK